MYNRHTGSTSLDFFIYNNNDDNNDYVFAINIVKLFYAEDFAVYAGGSIYWYLGKKQAKF